MTLLKVTHGNWQWYIHHLQTLTQCNYSSILTYVLSV